MSIPNPNSQGVYFHFMDKPFNLLNIHQIIASAEDSVFHAADSAQFRFYRDSYRFGSFYDLLSDLDILIKGEVGSVQT